MSNRQFQITIIVSGQEKSWLNKLEEVLRSAPAGVQIVRSDGGSEWIGFEQIEAYFQSAGTTPTRTRQQEVYQALSPAKAAEKKRNKSRNRVAAFAVLAVLVEHERIPVIVRCRRAECRRPRTLSEGGCRCTDRGYRTTSGDWCYSMSIFNGWMDGRDFWEISRKSLAALRAEDIPVAGKAGGLERFGDVTRQRLIEFVESIH